MPSETISRFLFRGSASGFGARLRRPSDITWKVQGASSLPVIGGVSESSVSWEQFQRSEDYKRLGEFRDFLQFKSARTAAQGDFVDAEAAHDLTLGKGDEGKIPARTTAESSVTGLVIAKRLKIDSVRAMLESGYPEPRKQPPIRPCDCGFDGVSIDGHELAIELNEKLFTQKPTLRDLSNAYERDDVFYKRHGRHFIHPGRPYAASRRKTPQAHGIVHCTLVSRIRWVSHPNPRVKIRGHVVAVEDFGRIYFGELLISDLSRRLTMVRIELGSPFGGRFEAVEVETNGTTWPA